MNSQRKAALKLCKEFFTQYPGMGSKELRALLFDVPVKRTRSNSHLETYYHFPPAKTGYPEGKGFPYGYTVFCRQESDGKWYASIAICVPSDQFTRTQGRTVAHRRYFQKLCYCLGTEKPTYDLAKKLTDPVFRSEFEDNEQER